VHHGAPQSAAGSEQCRVEAGSTKRSRDVRRLQDDHLQLSLDVRAMGNFYLPRLLSGADGFFSGVADGAPK